MFLVEFDLKGKVVFSSQPIETLSKDIFSFQREVLSTVFFPVNYKEEIYWSNEGGRLCVSNSFLVIYKKNKIPPISKDKEKYFLDKGRLDTGKTFFEAINRLVPNEKLFFSNGCLVKNIQRHDLRKCQKTADVFTYEYFKKKLDSEIENSSAQKNGVLLSGGADSALIALVMKKLGMDTTLFTFNAEPLHVLSRNDLFRSSKVAKHCGFNHKIIGLNFDDVCLSDLNKYVEKMPLASHLALPFDIMFKEVIKEDVSVVFCGQNADNLYNFGFTSRLGFNRQACIDLLGRYFLSNLYLKHLSNSSLSLSKLFSRSFAGSVARLYSYLKNAPFRQPQNLDELLMAVKNSSEGLIFLDNTHASLPETIQDYQQAIHQLIDFKVENYTRSGASSVVYAASQLYNLSCSLPYSAESMLPFYYNVERGLSDIIYPKKYIRMYLRELYPHYDEGNVTARGVNNEKCFSYSEWCENLMLETNFGCSLMSYLGKTKKDFYLDAQQFPTNAQLLNFYLNQYWFIKIKEYLINPV